MATKRIFKKVDAEENTMSNYNEGIYRLLNGGGVNFGAGGEFPFTQHKARVYRYKENYKLYKGLASDIFDQYNMNRHSSLYISLNLSSIICKKSADLLLGEPVSVSAGLTDDSPQQKLFDDITDKNYMNIVNYENALMNSIKGDSFYKIRYGQEYEGMLPDTLDPRRVIIENIPPENVFPVTFKGDKKKIMCYHVCTPVLEEEGLSGSIIGDQTTNQYRLEVESHFAGLIFYHRYQLTPQSYNLDGEVTNWKIGSRLGEILEEVTGLPKPLIVHVPNLAGDTWEGIDDLSEHKSVFDEINNRLSQVASILDKHSDPSMAVPAGTLQVDSNGNPIFHVAREKVFEMGSKEDVIPQYITWNGQLQEAYSELDRLINNVLMVAEIPPVAIGKADSGTSGSTGLAIRYRMLPLLSKINRKKQYYDKALKQVYSLAQDIYKITEDKSLKPVTPKLTFRDGLPRDEMIEANITSIRTGGKAVMSQKTAIMQAFNLTEEQADAEIKRIDEEDSFAMEKVDIEGSKNVFNEEQQVSVIDKFPVDVAKQGEDSGDKQEE